MDNLTTDWKKQIGTVRLCYYNCEHLVNWDGQKLQRLRKQKRFYEAKSDFAITTILATPYLYVSQGSS